MSLCLSYKEATTEALKNSKAKLKVGSLSQDFTLITSYTIP